MKIGKRLHLLAILAISSAAIAQSGGSSATPSVAAENGLAGVRVGRTGCSFA